MVRRWWVARWWGVEANGRRRFAGDVSMSARGRRTSLRSSHSKLAAALAMAPMFPAFLLPTTTTQTSSSAAGGSVSRLRCCSHARFVRRPALPFESTLSFHSSRDALCPRRAPPGPGRRGAAASADFLTPAPAPVGTAEVARTRRASILSRV